MIAESTLKTIAKLINAGDPQLVNLGGTIYLESNPTAEDINNLNDVMGREPIMHSHFQAQLLNLIVEAGNLQDIFEEKTT